MRKAAAAATAALALALVGTPGSARGPAARGNHIGTRLERMDYLRARKIITAYGWTPLAGDCRKGAPTCGDFPEVGNCSEDAPYFCIMHFVRGDRCLDLMTTGGRPEINGYGDTRVLNVTFSRGPCLGDP